MVTKRETQVIDTPDNEYYPYVPKDLLERLEKDFDIRKLIIYSPDLEYLKGVQDVLRVLRDRYDRQCTRETE